MKSTMTEREAREKLWAAGLHVGDLEAIKKAWGLEFAPEPKPLPVSSRDGCPRAGCGAQAMSDLDTLKAMLLRRRDGHYTEVEGDCREYGGDGNAFSVSQSAAHGHHFPCSLDLAWGDGYTGMVCSFYFDDDGNLIGHGVWE